jgi:hypothetical protein
MRWRAVLVSMTFGLAGLFVAAAVAKPTPLPRFVAGAWSGLGPRTSISVATLATSSFV